MQFSWESAFLMEDPISCFFSSSVFIMVSSIVCDSWNTCWKSFFPSAILSMSFSRFAVISGLVMACAFFSSASVTAIAGGVGISDFPLT